MVSERQSARRAITTGEQEEPEITEAFNVSLQRQLEIARENNRHKEELQRSDLGIIGRVLGGPKQASTSIAALVAVVSLGAAIACVIVMLVSTAATPVAERALALFGGLVTTALVYIFGARSAVSR